MIGVEVEQVSTVESCHNCGQPSYSGVRIKHKAELNWPGEYAEYCDDCAVQIASRINYKLLGIKC